MTATAPHPDPAGTPSALARLPPPLALQTCHAPGEGVHEPAILWPHLRDLHRLSGDDAPLPVRALLADRGLAGLPAAIKAWGAERVAVGSLVHVPLPSAEDPDALLIAPEEVGYRRLCRLLSRLAEDPERCALWLGTGLGPPDERHELNLHGLIACVRDVRLGEVLRAAGAEVVWRCQDRPDGEEAAGLGWPAVWLPLVSCIAAEERAGNPIRIGVAQRSRARALIQPALPVGLALDELADIGERFAARPDLILEAHALIGRCTHVPGGTWHMPPSRYADADAELARRARAGAEKRYPLPLSSEVTDRLAKELALIAAKGFSGYLLTVADLAEGRRTCGRGSGASSLVVYCLGITNVDPIAWKLLFERFLSPSRVDPPDLDVDFPWDERDAVFAYALSVYGPAHVAMVSVHTRLRHDGALRAVARAWGIPDPETTAMADALRGQRRYGRHVHLPEPWPAILADAEAVEGMHLHDGLHCGGLIITGPPIRDLTPVRPAAKHIDMATRRWEPASLEPVPAIAWEKDGAEEMGLVKIDILSNRSLAVIRDTLADLLAMERAIDEEEWRPAEDAATKELVAQGDTVGCFYIESPAMRQLQAKAGSGEFDRLVVHSSIIRPAGQRWIGEYLKRFHRVRNTGEHLPEWYPHPCLQGLLSETYGILSYQEDVMLVAQAVAGFTESEANSLRKALGTWGARRGLERYKTAFLAGALENGASEKAAQDIWENIASFGGYSFAKAHSASYAVVSFQAAYLKHHAPGPFHARVLANEGGFYAATSYVEEARRRGVRILGPSIVHSGWRTAPAGMHALRLGLHLVPIIGRELADGIVAERELAPFGGIGDLARRCRLGARILLSLARVGALADLRPDLHHAQVLWLAKMVGLSGVHRGHCREADAERERRLVRQKQQWLFPPPTWQDPAAPVLRRLGPEEEAWERFLALRICVDHHPVAFVPRPDALRGCDLRAAAHGAWVTVVGMLATSKQVSATERSGAASPMCFATIDDDTALIETVWFPEVYRRCGPALESGMPLRVRGQVQIEYGLRTVTVWDAAAIPFDAEAIRARDGLSRPSHAP